MNMDLYQHFSPDEVRGSSGRIPETVNLFLPEDFTEGLLIGCCDAKRIAQSKTVYAYSSDLVKEMPFVRVFGAVNCAYNEPHELPWITGDSLYSLTMTDADGKEYVVVPYPYRLESDIAKRNAGIIEAKYLKNVRIICIGTGSVASYLLPDLVRAGCMNMVLYDDDAFTLSNIARHQYADISTLGLNKALYMAEALKKINPMLNVTACPRKFRKEAEEEILSGIDDGMTNVFVGVTDSIRTNIEINELAYEKGAYYANSGLTDRACSVLFSFYWYPNAGLPRLKDVYEDTPIIEDVQGADHHFYIGGNNAMAQDDGIPGTADRIERASACLYGTIMDFVFKDTEDYVCKVIGKYSSNYTLTAIGAEYTKEDYPFQEIGETQPLWIDSQIKTVLGEYGISDASILNDGGNHYAVCSFDSVQCLIRIIQTPHEYSAAGTVIQNPDNIMSALEEVNHMVPKNFAGMIQNLKKRITGEDEAKNLEQKAQQLLNIIEGSGIGKVTPVFMDDKYYAIVTTSETNFLAQIFPNLQERKVVVTPVDVNDIQSAMTTVSSMTPVSLQEAINLMTPTFISVEKENQKAETNRVVYETMPDEHCRYLSISKQVLADITADVLLHDPNETLGMCLVLDDAATDSVYVLDNFEGGGDDNCSDVFYGFDGQEINRQAVIAQCCVQAAEQVKLSMIWHRHPNLGNPPEPLRTFSGTDDLTHRNLIHSLPGLFAQQSVLSMLVTIDNGTMNLDPYYCVLDNEGVLHYHPVILRIEERKQWPANVQSGAELRTYQQISDLLNHNGISLRKVVSFNRTVCD